MKSIETNVITDSKKYFGEVTGYLMAFCVEVQKADGTLGYSSNVYCTDIPDSINVAETYEESWELRRDIDCTAEMCLHSGNKLTGNILFNGYYTDYEGFDDEGDWSTFVEDKQVEVEETMSKYMIA